MRARDMYPAHNPNQTNPLRAAPTHPFLSHILIRLYPPSPVPRRLPFPSHPRPRPFTTRTRLFPAPSRLVRAPQRLQRLRPLPKP
jgi:hypothetical protein